jgi:hypothetical protein
MEPKNWQAGKPTFLTRKVLFPIKSGEFRGKAVSDVVRRRVSGGNGDPSQDLKQENFR